MGHIVRPSFLFPNEGADNMEQSIKTALDQFVAQTTFPALVILTSSGLGIDLALKFRKSANVPARIIGVKFPKDFLASKPAPGIPPEKIAGYEANGVVLVQADTFPFNRLSPNQIYPQNPWAQALSILGGGVQLLVQASLMACDAGAVVEDSHIVVAGADSVIIVRVCKTENFAQKFILREIVCKPFGLTITRGEPRRPEPVPQLPPKEGNPTT